MNRSNNRLSASDASVRCESVAVLVDVMFTFDSYNSQAVNAVNLEIKRGEIFGLLGPKSSGKSTLLRLPAGRLRPSAGKVKVFGRSPHWQVIKKRIFYLPQDPAHLNSAGWLGWLAKLVGWTNSTGTIPAIGQGLNLNRVLAGRPALVILDEPFAGRNAAGQFAIKELISTLSQSGKTVIFSSSLLSEAAGLCNRAAILYHGEVQAVGTLADLLVRPDAIRCVGPVLPVLTQERVMKIIRADLQGDNSLPAHRAVECSASNRDMTSGPHNTQSATTADRFLAPLTVSQQTKPSSASSDAVVDPVNHNLLTRLTRPATDSLTD